MVARVMARREALAEQLIPAGMIGVGLALLWMAFFDQGQVLSLFVGNAAYQQNYLHELFHDGRHAFAFSCH